jgi:HPt (histidine-containing phosphotransfer) domain-containing protein
VNDPPILDHDRLTLITGGNAALAAEFINALFAETGELLERLDDALRAADQAAISNIGHTLKGIAAEVGAMRLRAAAADLEAEIEPERWPQRVECLRKALDELRSHASANP